MRWHTAERLSPRQALTPDGFLIVTDTIIARCGDQIYHATEVPLDPDDHGMVTVARDASEVFRPEAIASFEGKAITDDHPFEEVTPANHRQLAIGHVQNVRRGTGDDADCLVADLVFTDPTAIEKVRGKRKLALSCGYDARYERVSRGRGAQRQIVGNHVALVDEGRCGARCSIGDSGAVIYSYLARDRHRAAYGGELPATHDTGCGCDVCQGHAGPPARPRAIEAADDRAAPPSAPTARRRRRRLILWADGKRLWQGWTQGRGRDFFDPSEPRNPAGEWTAGAGGSKAARPPGEETAGNGGASATSTQGKGEKVDGNTAATTAAERSRVPGGSPGEPSGAYTRGSPRDVGGGGLRPDGAAVRAVYRATGAGAQALAAAEADNPVYHELGAGSGATFAQYLTASKADSKFGAAVHVYDPADYDQMRLFTTPDAKAGFALHGDDIISVFRRPGGPKNGAASMLALAAQEGGRRLDCFDTVLPDIYGKNGFKAVARLPFNDEYKPDGWDYSTFGKYNAGRPDVVFMTYDPSHHAPYKTGDGAKVEDYDAGTAAQKQALGGKTSDAFDPSEPRIKSGEGGGQWTSSGGGGGASSGGGKSSGGGVPASGAGTGGASGKSASFFKGEPTAATKIGNVAVAHWANPPKTNAGWDQLAEVDSNVSPFSEPKLTTPPGKKQGAGVIIQEPDGRVWIVHPTNQFGGYKATFPKGTVEPGMTLRGTALKEAYEESGLHVALTGFAGDVERTTGTARYYFAKRVGGTPDDAGWESEAVTLAHPDDLKGFLNHEIDHGIVDQHILKLPPKPAASPADPNAPVDTSNWTKLGGKLGSNPGGQYADPDGNKFYVKVSKSDDHARNEFLAARLYEAAGAPVLPTRLVKHQGQLATATPWQDVSLINQNDDAQRKLAQEHFATHAWLANWDAAGTGFDNQGMVNGKMTTLDPGGSLLYRAQGEPKGDAFGDQVVEWDSLRHPGNSYAHKIFGDIGGKALRASALNVAKVSDKTIDDLVQAHGPGSVTAKTALSERLIKRKRDIVGHAVKTADARHRSNVRHFYLDIAA
jgi:8-oxo-dGTP pyrophosphatase MutT (NUDIX family)/uncharacterized membrane protein YgcG